MKDKALITPISTLLFSFSLPSGRSIYNFRGAINSKINKQEHPLFNNHDGEKDKEEFTLVQYKILNHKAAIIGIGFDATNELNWFATQFDGKLSIENKVISNANILNLTTRYLKLDISNELKYTYSSSNWVPFKELHQRESFETLQKDVERLKVLEHRLTNHIVTLYTSLNAHELLKSQEIVVRILSGYQAPTEIPLFYKNTPHRKFSIKFLTNARLISDIGIGRAASIGGGTLIEEKSVY